MRSQRVALMLGLASVMLAACNSSPDSPGLAGNPGKAREDMIKWHQQHDKIPPVVHPTG